MGKGEERILGSSPVDCRSRARGGARVERLFLVPEDTEKRSREGRRVSKESRPRAGGQWPLKRLTVEPEPLKEANSRIHYRPLELPEEDV